jgi:hypothetical protein
MQQNNEGEKAKGGWVLCNFLKKIVLWWVLFFSLHFYQAQKYFLSPRIQLLPTN